jgi:cysteine-rich repeat protein
MVIATRWLVVGPMLLASGAVACGRTDLTPGPLDAANGEPHPQPAADAAPVPDLAPLSGPDLARSSNPNGMLCGNGRLDPIETCDDGNTDPGDGCSDICGIEPGFHCVIPGKRCAPICGDRMMVGLETCDDGNAMGGDGCSEICVTEACWDCSSGFCLPRPGGSDDGNCQNQPVASCGNGHIEGAEECDDGAENSDDSYGGCSMRCHHIGCGDGLTNGPEQCDLGMAENRAVYAAATECTRICTIPHYCGDNIVDSDWGEQCDLGALNGKSMCTQFCTIVLP